jgi:hypothetical protein
MNRWFVALLMTIGGLFFLFPRAGEAPAAQQAGEQPPSGAPARNIERGREAPSVRVEHELIEVPLRLPQPPAARTVATHAVDRRARHSPQPEHFVARARRALFGDGRYRPEPFPRPATR